MLGRLLGKLRAVDGGGFTWSRWVKVWEQRSGRRIIERLRKNWLFDSRFEQLEPRQMLDAAGGGTGSQPPEIEYSYLGLPTEVAELAAPFFNSGSEFSESSLSFPTEQIVDNGDSPPVQNIFQVKSTPWNNLTWADHLVTTAADDNDGTTKLVQLRQLDDGNTLVLFRSITVGTTYQVQTSGGGGTGVGGGGAKPAILNRSTDAWFVALVTDDATAQSIQSSNSLVPLSPSLFGFTLLVESDFGYNRSKSGGYSNFTVINDMSTDMDINWNSDVTQSYEMGEEFDNDATLQVVTDAVASVNQTHHWVYTGQALASGDYSSNRPWTKSGGGTTSYTATSGTVWDMNYSEGDVSENDGLEFQFTVTEDFSTTASHTYNYSGSGTAAGDAMGGYQMATRNETFVRSGDSATDDSPVTEFAYHSAGSNLELVEPGEDDGTGDGSGGGNSGGGGSETPPAPIEVTVFHNDTITSTFSPVYQGDHDYTTTWTSLRAANGDWTETLVTNENNDFDTTGTVYTDTTSLNSISTSSRTGTEFHQLVDFTAASGAHHVVTTSSDMDFSGATGEEMVVSGTINVDSQIDNLVDTTSMSSDVTINTLRVSGEYSDGVQLLLPSDWQGILGTIDTLGGAAVDWDWLGGGTVSVLLLDMAITDYSSTENDFSSISPLTPSATPVSTYGTEIEFFVDDSIRFTSTGDSAWTSDYSGTADFDTKTVFVKGTAPDADTLDWMFNESNSSDSSNHNGTFTSSDLENVIVTSTPIYGTEPDPENGSGGGSGSSTPDEITGYDSVVTGTTQRAVSNGSTYNGASGGFVSNNAKTDDYEGNKTDVSFSYLWQQQSTTTDGFTSGSWTTFGGEEGPFLTTNTIAGGTTSTAMPMDSYSIMSHVRKETNDGIGGTSIDDVYSYQPWSGGGSFGVIWDQNTTLTLTETPIDLGEEDPEDPPEGDAATDVPTTYLKISVTGDSNIWTTGDTNHDLDGDNARLDVLKQIDSNPTDPNMVGPEPNTSWHDISNADQMTGNRTYSNTMHTRRVYTSDGVDLITNGVERETWQNKARIPVDEGSEWELNDGAGTITERTIQENGFLIAESKGDIKTTATDWTVSIRDSEDPEGDAANTGPLSGNQIYNKAGSEIRVSGQIETIEDLKNTSKYDTVWTLEEAMTASGPNYYHGSGERNDSKVTHIDASERSIRTTTVIGSTVPATETTPDGSTLVETVTLELPVEDNTTTFDVTRDGTYEKRFISTNTSTGTVHVNALEGSYNGFYVGYSINQVINGSVTTTRNAEGDISVEGSIVARTHTDAVVEASANSFWLDGYKSNSSVDPPSQSDLSFYTDDALAAAGSGPSSGGTYGDYNRFDVGEVASRAIDTHFVFDETFEWTRVAIDQDNDGIHEWVQDTGPIKTETLVVSGTDSREIHHWGIDLIGPYDQTISQETDVATATNPAGYVNKAATLRGDNSLPGRIPTYSGGNEPPPVDDGGSDYRAGDSLNGDNPSGSEGTVLSFQSFSGTLGELIGGSLCSCSSLVPFIWPSAPGHHWVPVGVVNDLWEFLDVDAIHFAYGFSSETLAEPHNGRPYNGISHFDYNALVKEELKKLVDHAKSQGRKVTIDEMEAFAENIMNGRGQDGQVVPGIKKFNQGVHDSRQRYIDANPAKRGNRLARDRDFYLNRGRRISQDSSATSRFKKFLLVGAAFSVASYLQQATAFGNAVLDQINDPNSEFSQVLRLIEDDNFVGAQEKLELLIDRLAQENELVARESGVLKEKLAAMFESLRIQVNAMEQSLRFDGEVHIDPDDDFFDQQSPLRGLLDFCP